MSTGAIVKDLVEESAPYWRSLEHGLAQTEEGKYATGILTKYTQRTQQIFAGLHTAATTANKTAGTPMPASGHLMNNARVTARNLEFGSNDAALTTLVRSSHKRNGPAATQNLMDHIAMYLREDKEIGVQKHASEFKEHAVKDIEKNDPAYKKFQQALPKAKAFAAKNNVSVSHALDLMEVKRPHQYTTTSDYHKPSEREKKITSWFYGRLSPLIVIPHLGTILNTALAVPNKNLLEALHEMSSSAGRGQLQQRHIANGLVAEGALRSMRAIEEVRNGAILKHLPGSLQDVMGKVTSTPGFNYVRDWQIAFTGSAVYHSAIDYAAQLAKNPADKRLIHELERYGMTPRDLQMIRSTGTMTQDQLERATWNGVNKNIFLDNSLNRSYKAGANAWTRAFTMYHGYVSSQAKFVKERISTDIRNGDTRSIASMAKATTMLGVVFPVAGEALKMLEMVGRGQWAQIQTEAHDDYEAMTFQKQESIAAHARDFLETYVDAWSHLGGFGIAFGLVQGAGRGMLAQQLSGAAWGTAIKYLQDFARPISQEIAGKKVNLAPAGRDALEIGLKYGIGRFLKHELLPTKREQEEAKGGSHKLKRLKAGGGLKKMTFN